MYKLSLAILAFFASAVYGQTCIFADDPNLVIDQSATLQGCINSALDYSTINVTDPTRSHAPHVRINQTIRINGRHSLAIECPGGHAMSAGAPGFYWGGPDGGTMVNTRGSTVRIEHCNFFAGLHSSGGANVLIDADISATVGVTAIEHRYSDLGLI